MAAITCKGLLTSSAATALAASSSEEDEDEEEDLEEALEPLLSRLASPLMVADSPKATGAPEDPFWPSTALLTSLGVSPAPSAAAALLVEYFEPPPEHLLKQPPILSRQMTYDPKKKF